MKLVSFSLSTQCSLPSTAKLASTHLDNIGFHKHQKNSPPAIANIRQLLWPSIEPPRRQLPLSKPPGKMVSLNKVQVASYCQTEQKLDFNDKAKWPTSQHRCRSGLHETQHQVLTQIRHQNSCRRAQKKLLRRCSPHQDGPEEQELPKHKNWTFEEKILSLTFMCPSITCYLLLPICLPKNCHPLVGAT